MYRDKDLLGLAQGEECLLRVHPKCHGTYGETTVACHSNELKMGKGKSLKADDCYTVWGCVNCHFWLDFGDASYEAKLEAWEAAYIRQVRAWDKIASNTLLKPWKVEAARRVLDHLRGLSNER